MLKDGVIYWVSEVIGNKEIFLQQDGTTSHTSRIVQKRRKTISRHFGQSNYGPRIH